MSADPASTGRFIVTFRRGASQDALNLIHQRTGLAQAQLMSSADFSEGALDPSQLPANGGVVLEQLGIAVLGIEELAAGQLAQQAGADSPILAIEPEGYVLALHQGQGLTLDYLRGFRDAALALHDGAQRDETGDALPSGSPTYEDGAAHTWGLLATQVAQSRYSSQGVRLAVLDTGLDLLHPDFVGRSLQTRSFIAGVASVQDGHGHGTHCAGTATGALRPSAGPRYGVAHGAELFVGKVLPDQGPGSDLGVLAGIEWALTSGCQVISISLGADVPTTSVAYETAGQRALEAGCLLVAAASNNARRALGQFGLVGRPANSRSIMAVGAVDAQLRLADFSPRDTALIPGTAIDIVGPGVAVLSSWPMPTRQRNLQGTSMATPHVAGIAALWAQASGDRGAALWHRLISNARSLPLLADDVGRGLVQAP